MDLDIQSGIRTALLFSIIGCILAVFIGIRSLQAGKKLVYFRKRQELISYGWRLLIIACLLGFLAYFLARFGEPAVYTFFKPSPTITLTPTMTITPTITLTQTQSPTPSITPTSEFPPTPQLPNEILGKFSALITPNPNAAFSRPLFSKTIDSNNQPVDPATEFSNPIGALFGSFSYDKMLAGSQWSSIWLRTQDNAVICFETYPWIGSTGGYGFTECVPSSDQWWPGYYEVQIFLGSTWMVRSGFSVIGEPPTPTFTLIPSRTSTLKHTTTSTRTPLPSKTPPFTPTFSLTPGPPSPLTSSPTTTPTRTPPLTDTRWPSPSPPSTLSPTSPRAITQKKN
jgi:type VI secretion system secreted protein VgrG